LLPKTPKPLTFEERIIKIIKSNFSVILPFKFCYFC